MGKTRLLALLGTVICLSALIVTGVQASSYFSMDADSYEPDDDFEHASTINNGDSQDHSIDPDGDQDYVTFTLTAESGISLSTSGSSGGDTRLNLYDSDQNPIDFNDDSGDGGWSLIERICNSNPLPSGTYYGMVEGSGSAIPEYQLNFSASTCIQYTDFIYLPLIKSPSTPPGAFGKIRPTNGSTDQSNNLRLDWGVASNAVSYEYCIDKVIGGVCDLWISVGSSTEVYLLLDGNTTYEWQVRAVNGSYLTYADGGTEWSFTTWVEPTSWTTIMSENFEGNFPHWPSWWTLADYNPDDGKEYLPAKRDCRAHNGSSSGWMVGGGTDGISLSCGVNYPDEAYPVMIYGPFNTEGATAAQLNFYHWTHLDSSSDDQLCVWANIWPVNMTGHCFQGDSGGWSSYTLDLSDVNGINFLNEDQVYIAFTLQTFTPTTYPEGAYIDDIVLRKCVYTSCTGAAPRFSVGSTSPADTLKSILNPFIITFISPASLIHKNK